MPNTYTQLYIHLVFAVKYRNALINTSWDERMRSYMAGIINNNGHKLLAINNMPDHMHIFIGLNPKQSISELMRLIKSDSSEWINKEKLSQHRFQWQEGYGAFSHSRSQLDTVVKYILNQQEHHKKENFIDEYKKMLAQFAIDYNDHYIFTVPE